MEMLLSQPKGKVKANPLSKAITLCSDKKKGSKNKFQGEHYYCKKKGHMIAKCHIKKADEKNGTLKSSKGEETTNTTEVQLELWMATIEECSSTQCFNHS